MFYLPRKLYDRIMYAAKLHPDFEISGWGTMEKGDDGLLHITDVYLCEHDPNETNSSEVLMKPESVTKLMYRLHKEGKDPGALRWWWHFHPSSVFFSGQDKTTIEECGRHGWLAATVFNRKGDTFSGIYITDPAPLMIEKITLKIEEGHSVSEEWKEEVKANITTPMSKKTRPWKGRGGNSHGSSGYRHASTIMGDRENSITRPYEKRVQFSQSGEPTHYFGNGLRYIVASDSLQEWDTHLRMWCYVSINSRSKAIKKARKLIEEIKQKYLKEGIPDGKGGRKFEEDKESDEKKTGNVIALPDKTTTKESNVVYSENRPDTYWVQGKGYCIRTSQGLEVIVESMEEFMTRFENGTFDHDAFLAKAEAVIESGKGQG